MDITKIIKNTKDIIEGHSPGNYSIVLAVPVAFLVLGFLIWDTYLYTFGFIEGDILRGQFIMTGFFFMFFSLLAFLLVNLLISLGNWLWEKFNLALKFLKKETAKNETPSKETLHLSAASKFSLYIGISFAWFIFYIIEIFPFVPAAIGGGQPRSLSLLASESTMPVLNSLSLVKAAGATYQTINVCIVNEDSQGVVILLSDRVLRIDRSLYNGFGSLPGPNAAAEQQCVMYAHNWSLQGLHSGLLLFEISLTNFALGLIGQGTSKFIIQTNPACIK